MKKKTLFKQVQEKEKLLQNVLFYSKMKSIFKHFVFMEFFYFIYFFKILVTYFII